MKKTSELSTARNVSSKPLTITFIVCYTNTCSLLTNSDRLYNLLCKVMTIKIINPSDHFIWKRNNITKFICYVM